MCARARALPVHKRAYFSTEIYTARATWRASRSPCVVCILFHDRISFVCADRAPRGREVVARKRKSSQCRCYANSRSSGSTSPLTSGMTTRCTIARLRMKYSRTTSKFATAEPILSSIINLADSSLATVLCHRNGDIEYCRIVI